MDAEPETTSSERPFQPELAPPPGQGSDAIADVTHRRTYVFSDDIVLAVNVALVTNRPLLVFGPPGSGKSSVARDIARELRWRYYEHIVTSRTEAADLQWRVDLVRRLADSQAKSLDDDENAYVAPGALWWAFDPGRARTLGWRASDRGAFDADQTADRAVVLIDEIDKADVDLPNNLLVPLGSWRFAAPIGQVSVDRDQVPLVVITSNNERDLPPAFVRRCVILNLPEPTHDHLVRVADAHLGRVVDGVDRGGLFRAAADIVVEHATVTPGRQPSTAEYLDFLRACLELHIASGSGEWEALRAATLAKEPDPLGRRVTGPAAGA